MPELPGAPAPPEMVTDGLGGGEVRAALAALAGVAAAVAGGQWVIIQAPVSLGWDSAELATFGSRPRIQVGYGVGRPR